VPGAAALQRRRPSPAAGHTNPSSPPPPVRACDAGEQKELELGLHGVLAASFVPAKRPDSRPMPICRHGRLSAKGAKRAIIGPRGRGARAASAACRLAAGPRAQAGAREIAVGRFLPWAESRDAAQYCLVNCFNEFQKPILMNFV
jgi:hypothetical protein